MNDPVAMSKFLSLVLRHKPETIDLPLDENGWAFVSDLLRLAPKANRRLTPELLQKIVAESDKRRFAFSADGLKIRANQGHSIAVDLALDPTPPPALLYHGTATRFLDSIRVEGLRSMSRRHVHLSAEQQTAVTVGRRHGSPVVLTVRSSAMHGAGHLFTVSDNGVWLTACVPSEYLVFPE